MRVHINFGLSVLAVAGLALAACSPSSGSAEAPQSYASIQELMLHFIDPAADEIWEAVSYKATLTETIDKKPQTDQEWADLRAHAVILAEAPNLLVVPGRPVAMKGGRIADEGSPGNLTTMQIQTAIANDPRRFAAAARKLQDTARKMVDAIDAKDPDQVEIVGSELDEACESCHLQYWYPEGRTAPAHRAE